MHDFIQGFRNFSSHFKIAESNWKITNKGDADYTTFLLDKDDLLAWAKWNNLAKSFIETNCEKIDIYSIFFEYLKKVEHFYNWHKTTVISEYNSIISEHLTHVKWLNHIKSKTSWNMILSHIPKDVDPYLYLENYLNKEQMDDVLSYPYKSKEQIDRLIEIIDTHKVCDELIKEKVYSILTVR